MRRLLCLIAAMLGLATNDISAQAAPAPPQTGICKNCQAVLELALSNPRRDADRARDVYRHPAETIAFFGVRPDMTVVEVLPGGGWFTRILIPYLGGTGHYIALNPDVSNVADDVRKHFADLATTFPPKAAAWTGTTPASIHAYNSDGLPPELKGTVDRVMLMRESHTLKRWGMFDAEIDTYHALLKPDGMLGIEQHRAKPDAPDAYVDGNKGYLREDDLIKAIESHGFQLVARSEINANPRDPANYPEGVWTLPPGYRLGDTDRARYEAIGESDRMTLLFKKRS